MKDWRAFSPTAQLPTICRRCEMVVRINALSSEWGADDLLAAAGCEPDAILLPKVDKPRDILEAGDVLDDIWPRTR